MRYINVHHTDQRSCYFADHRFDSLEIETKISISQPKFFFPYLLQSMKFKCVRLFFRNFFMTQKNFGKIHESDRISSIVVNSERNASVVKSAFGFRFRGK